LPKKECNGKGGSFVLRAKKKFTRLLLLIVCGLGLTSTAFLLSDPPIADSANFDYDNGSPSLFEKNSNIISQRGLASVGAIEQKLDSVFDFDCNNLQQTFATAKPRFRLKGTGCGNTPTSNESDSATQVQNESNGYVGTVFHRTPGAFTTDFINLSEGENKIKITFDSNGEKIEKNFTVVRAPAAVKK
jgi:hypothetical protein